MPSLITIPYCTAEIHASFARPIIQLIADKAAPLQALVDALLPFGFSFENAEANGSQMAQHRTTLRIPPRNIAFEFGAQAYKFVKDAFTWDSTPDDLKVLQAAEEALISQGAEIASRSISVGMHIQLLETPRADVLAPFAPKPFFTQDVPPEYKPEQFGFSLKLPRGFVIVDYSRALANGLFIRITADLDGSASLSDVAEKMHRDERFLADLLDVQGDLS
jgi:hypothetical protein